MLDSKLFESAFNAVADAVLIIKFSIKRANILHANPAFEKLVGYRLNEVKDKDMINLFLSGTSNIPSDLEKLRQGFLQKRKYTTQLKFNNKDGFNFNGDLSVSPLDSDDPNLYVVTIKDISPHVIVQRQLDEARHKYEIMKLKLDQLSKTDSLTGVYNPKAINHELSILFNSAKRNYGSFSMLFIEIDGIDKLEKDHGEAGTKKAIEHFAITLTRNFRRRSDIIIRYGFNQFLVCFAGANDAQTFNLADKILQSIQNIPVILDNNQKVNQTISIGMLNTVVNLESNLDHTIGVAHLAVEKAKKQGGNQIYTAKSDAISS